MAAFQQSWPSFIEMVVQWENSRLRRERPGFDSSPMHLRFSVVKVCRGNYFMKFDVTFTGCWSLKGGGHLCLNKRPFDLQSKALPLHFIFVQVAPWLLRNSRHQNLPIFFFFFALVALLQKALTILYRICGLVVEFLRVTQETGKRFLADTFK